MKPIYLFHGEDSYSTIQKAALWQTEFEKKFGDMNIEVFDGENFNASMFAEAVSTLPFLSEKKLIIIRNFFKDAPIEELKKVSEKFDLVDASCVIVFTERQKADSRTALFKNIKKQGQINEFPLLDKFALINWIEKEVLSKKGLIQRTQASELAENVGPDLWQMSHEIEKLALHSNGQQISSKEIDSLTSPNLSTSIFKLTDHLALKKRKESLNTLKTLLESGENPIQILFMIVRHFRILIQIKACMDKNLGNSEIIKKIKQHPFVVSTGMKQSRNFNDENLKKIYQYLLKIDIATKNGSIKMSTGDISELRLSLEKFIVSFCT